MSSTAQAKKDALIANLVEARKNILSAASALLAKQRDEVFLGSWSVKDLLAHLIGGTIRTIARILQVELDDERVHHRQIRVRRIGDFHSLSAPNLRAADGSTTLRLD